MISVQKGDIIKTADLEGIIIKYSSNTEIFIEDESEEIHQIHKEDILEKIGSRKVTKAQEKKLSGNVFQIIDRRGNIIKLDDKVIYNDPGVAGIGVKGILKYENNENIFIWGDGYRRMIRKTEALDTYQLRKDVGEVIEEEVKKNSIEINKKTFKLGNKIIFNDSKESGDKDRKGILKMIGEETIGIRGMDAEYGRFLPILHLGRYNIRKA